jgi:probable F420-dependent oxidoreductase
MQRPFRFGVLCEEMGNREAWFVKARRAEELGYDTLLLRDHFRPGTFGDQFAPISSLMAAAMVTSKLRIGTIVFDNDYRHPVVLGKEVATLDVLSGGRFEFGLGAGWMGSEYEQAGIPFDPPGTRVDRFEEALRIFKGLFAGEPLTFAGKHYRIAGIQNFPVSRMQHPSSMTIFRVEGLPPSMVYTRLPRLGAPPTFSMPMGMQSPQTQTRTK